MRAAARTRALAFIACSVAPRGRHTYPARAPSVHGAHYSPQQCVAVGSKNAIVAARRKCYPHDMGSLHEVTRSSGLHARPAPEEETGRVVPLRPRLLRR